MRNAACENAEAFESLGFLKLSLKGCFLFLALLARGDVLRHAGNTPDHSILPPDGERSIAQPAHRAVLVKDTVFSFARPLAFESEGGQHTLFFLGMNRVAPRAGRGQIRSRRQPENTLESRVHVKGATEIKIVEPENLAHIFRHLAKLLFARLKLRIALLELRGHRVERRRKLRKLIPAGQPGAGIQFSTGKLP